MIATRRRAAPKPHHGWELHFIDADGDADWAAHVQRLWDTGLYDRVYFCNMTLVDEITLERIGGRANLPDMPPWDDDEPIPLDDPA